MLQRTTISLGKYSKLFSRSTKRLIQPATCVPFSGLSIQPFPGIQRDTDRILQEPQKKDQNGVQIWPYLVWKTPVPEVTPNILEGQDGFLKDLKLQQPTCMGSKKCGGGDDLKKKCDALAAKKKGKPKKKKKGNNCEEGGKKDLEKICHALEMLKKCRKCRKAKAKKGKKDESKTKCQKVKKKEEGSQCKGSGKKDKDTIEKEKCDKMAKEAMCKKMAEEAKKREKEKKAKKVEVSKSEDECE
ncbi:axoneme-associated protein mst101(1)-like [Drosophila bipectinata]|uniref:axoneme-associated protein mst101(1)-like n=1 Tax=Drosophila bipectinata TaxID=42026 RepID=UPI001C8956B4|nr:axoneme-associated protein mst101(2)-like [Drosophila bipectinata]